VDSTHYETKAKRQYNESSQRPRRGQPGQIRGLNAAYKVKLARVNWVFIAFAFLAVPYTNVFAGQTAADQKPLQKLLADSSEAGLSAGASAPQFNLKDQYGQERKLESLGGAKGLVLVFFRSADW
jgi:cytochrome oxidase Cu insertion factor (SCO1/SenC/PrrC family)